MANDFPRSYLRTLIAEDEARRDTAAARHVPLDVQVASVTAIDEARARLHPVDDTAWRADAACLGVNSDLFFPGPHENDRGRLARDVCAGCVVQVACLEFALNHDERFGIWGGLSERERRRLRRARRSGAA